MGKGVQRGVDYWGFFPISRTDYCIFSVKKKKSFPWDRKHSSWGLSGTQETPVRLGLVGGCILVLGATLTQRLSLPGLQPCVHRAGDEHDGLAGQDAGTPRPLPAWAPQQPGWWRLAGA